MFFVYIEWYVLANTKTDFYPFFFGRGKAPDEGHLGVVVVVPKTTREKLSVCNKAVVLVIAAIISAVNSSLRYLRGQRIP